MHTHTRCTMAGLPFLGNGHVEVNMKCVIFATIILALYYSTPLPATQTGWGLAVSAYGIFFAAYVSMAYYDHVYQCKKGRLKYGGGFSLTSAFKTPPPAGSTADPQGFDSVAWGHVAFIAPLIGYTGYLGLSGSELPQWLAVALVFTSIMAVLAHAPNMGV